MRLLEQHKKKFFILSGLLFVLAIVGTLFGALLSSIYSTLFVGGALLRWGLECIITKTWWRMISENFFSYYLPIWLITFLGALGTSLNLACFGAGAFHSAKTGKRSLFTVIGAFLMIFGFVVSIITTVLSYFVPSMIFGRRSFLDLLFNVPLPFVLAVYLILFGFVKPKGPAIPIIGTILIVLTGGVVSFFQLLPAIVNLFSSYWPFVYNLFGFICSTIAICSSLCFYFGLLLHVPLAYYKPKAAEQIPETVIEIEEN